MVCLFPLFVGEISSPPGSVETLFKGGGSFQSKRTLGFAASGCPKGKRSPQIPFLVAGRVGSRQITTLGFQECLRLFLNEFTSHR